MPLLLDDLRLEFVKNLFEQRGHRFSMDKALAHVLNVAYAKGLEDDKQMAHPPGAESFNRERKIGIGLRK